jgi:hypothetical protein
MSKGKYKRKRDKARQKTKQEVPNIRLPNSEVVPAEKQPESTKESNTKRGNKEETSMGFREAVKRSSVTDWCIAAFTLVLMVVAVYQYTVTGSQLDVMRRDQRPWMKLNFDSFTAKTGTEIAGNLHMVNNGKTPAKKIEGRFAMEKVRNGDSPRLDYAESGNIFTTGAIFPNEPQTKGMGMQHSVQKSGGINYEPVILTEDAFTDFMAGNIFFVAYANVSYSDFFGVRHWTKFCNFLYPTGIIQTYSAKNCTDYNDIDDN